MSYSVVLTTAAHQGFNDLPHASRPALLDILQDLKHYPHTKNEGVPLSGYEAFKITTAQYRIVFTVNSSRRQIAVRIIRGSRDTYKRLANLLR